MLTSHRRAPWGREPLRRSQSALLVAGLLAAGVAWLQPAASAAPDPGSIASSPTAIGVDAALAQAKNSGKSVAVTSATTQTSTLTANSDGTLTLQQDEQPVRRKVGGAWQALSATLVQRSDGSIGPTLSASDLTLSSGGSGPLATMSDAGRSLSLSLPLSLPAPTLSGATATYANVLDGVDLQVDVTDQGSFDEVLIVKNAVAAQNPALATLKLSTQTTGLTLGADAAGNITTTDALGQPVFTATAPLMWDSSTDASGSTGSASAAPSSQAALKPTSLSADAATATATASPSPTPDPSTGQGIDPASGLPVDSSAQGPGQGAQVAPIATSVSGDTIDLTPAASLLQGSDTTYPVYIDPQFVTPSDHSSLQAWTQTNSYYDSSSYWKSSDLLRVGDQDWESPTFVARSFVQVSVPSSVSGATVLSSQLNFTEEWSPSCTQTGVELVQVNGISSATTWDKPPTEEGQVGSTQTVAHGYDSSCPAAGVGYDISQPMQTAANSKGKTTSLAFELRATDESDPYGWKEFANTISSTTTYDHPPTTPTTATMSTSPTTSCTGDTVGDGPVTLSTKVSDPDGGTLGVTYQVTDQTTGASFATSDPNSLYEPSGSPVGLQLSKADLEAAAANKATTFTWKAEVTDFKYSSGWSPTCSFTFDPTRPGAPQISTPQNGVQTDCDASGTVQAGTMGQPETFTINPPASGTAPTSYAYQLNGGAPLTLAASSGPISVTPTRITNSLSVTGLSGGANYGSTVTCAFEAAPPAQAAADQDLTGSGTPDLLMTGKQDSLPSGLWLSQNQAGPGADGDGQVDPDATDIGNSGSGVEGQSDNTTGYGSPSDFDQAIAFSGQFTRSQVQDVFVYYPTGTYAGDAMVLPGNGDGSPLDVSSARAVLSGALTDTNGDNPLQLANADNVTADNDPSAGLTAYPDLIGISGDGTNGYTLNLYTGDTGTFGSYGAGQGGIGNYLPLTTPTPTGGTDWNDWTITTAQLPATSPTPGTAMYLWDKSTGDLYLWTSLSYDSDSGELAFTQNQVATGFSTGTNLTLQAADINGDGTPDLWTTTSAGAVTAHLLTSADTFSSSVPSSSLAPLTHSWDLSDQAQGAVASGSAADDAGTLPLSGTSTSTTADEFATGQLYSPAVSLNSGITQTTGALTATGPALNLSSSFTVSVWAKPTAYNGDVLSQDGAHTAGISIYPNSADNQWYVCLATADTTTATSDCSHGGNAALGTWSNITLTYSSSTQHMELYLNGVPLGTTDHAPVASTLFRGDFNLGDGLSAGTRGRYFSGFLSSIRTWSTALTPAQIAYDAPTDGPVVFPSDGTQYPSGSHWSTGATTLSFTSGTLTVTSAGTTTFTQKPTTGTGTSSSVLTLLTNGDLAAYDNSADASGGGSTGRLWDTGTTTDTGDVMFIQPSGNVLLHAADGLALWSTGTAFGYDSLSAPGSDQWLLNSASAGSDTAEANLSAPPATATYTTDHAGTANAATVFDGQSVEPATGTGVLTTADFTVSAWIKLNNLNTDQTAVGQGTVNHQAFYLGYTQNSGWVFQMTTSDATTTTFPTANTTATAGVWTHLVGVYDVSTGTLTLYVNGKSVDSSTDTTPQYNPAGRLTIGAITTVGSTSPYNEVNGAVSDVRVYNGELTAAEIASM